LQQLTPRSPSGLARNPDNGWPRVSPLPLFGLSRDDQVQFIPRVFRTVMKTGATTLTFLHPPIMLPRDPLENTVTNFPPRPPWQFDGMPRPSVGIGTLPAVCGKHTPSSALPQTRSLPPLYGLPSPFAFALNIHSQPSCLAPGSYHPALAIHTRLRTPSHQSFVARLSVEPFPPPEVSHRAAAAVRYTTRFP